MLIFILPIKKKEIAFLVQGIIDVFFVSSESPITLFCVQNTALQTFKRQPTFSTRLDFNFSSVIHLPSDRRQLCFQIRVYLIDFVIFFSKQRASLSIRNMNSHVFFVYFFILCIGILYQFSAFQLFMYVYYFLN